MNAFVKKIYNSICLIVIAVVFSSICIEGVSNSEEFFYGTSYEQSENNNIELSSNIGMEPKMYTYFKNLNQNIGNNDETMATCGYVSLAMVLGYYQISAGFNNVVDNKYIVKGTATSSDGTLYEANSNRPENVGNYLNYLRDNYKNTSLHAYLTLLGTNSLNSNPASLPSTYKEMFGTTSTILGNTLDSYMSGRNVKYLRMQPFKRNSFDQDMIDYIKSNIDKGIPVIMGFGGHSRVFYHYTTDITGTTFISHEGYKTSTRRLFNVASLGDMLYTADVFHIHQNVVDYTYLNSNYHIKKYDCGCTEQEKHSYRINLNHKDCPCGSSLHY